MFLSLFLYFKLFFFISPGPLVMLPPSAVACLLTRMFTKTHEHTPTSKSCSVHAVQLKHYNSESRSARYDEQWPSQRLHRVATPAAATDCVTASLVYSQTMYTRNHNLSNFDEIVLNDAECGSGCAVCNTEADCTTCRDGYGSKTDGTCLSE